MYSGPHIKRDGLVFGYDTGYGIADNNTATRFYPGRPTTNEISDANLMSGWSSYSNGNDGTFTTEFGTIGYRINNRASWNGLYKDFSLPSTGTYTFSALFRYRGGSSSNNGATVYVSGWGGSDTATGIDKTKVNEWQRIEKTVSVTDTTLRYYLISYGGSGAVSSWDVTMPQIEKQTTRSPFLNGTRSSTQSLIDLTKTTNIDVSNVSFDSNGLPTFDGTDDYINLNSVSPLIAGGDFSLEAIIKGNTQDHKGIITINTSSGGNRALFLIRHASMGIYDGGTWYIGNIDVDNNEWHHVVLSYVRSTKKAIIYVDGNVSLNSTTNNMITVATNDRISIGQEWDGGSTSDHFNGQIPVAKIYNKAISPQEVQQNFKAYKNRFNL